MKENQINIVDTIKIFKKNIKLFYSLMLFGFVIGLIGIYINIKHVSEQYTIESKVLIKNPFENYELLDILTLSGISVSDKTVSLVPVSEKIRIYKNITQEYARLMLSQPEKIFNRIIITKDYESNLSFVQDSELRITLKKVSNLNNAERDINKFVNEVNNLLSPIIINNIIQENEYISTLINITSKKNIVNGDTKLQTLYNLRSKSLNRIKDKNIEIFYVVSSSKLNSYSNIRIFLSSTLSLFFIFLLIIIIRK